MLLLEADEPAPLGDPELGGERLDVGPVLAVADEHEQRVDAAVARAPRSVRTRSSGRLIARQPAGPADDERVVVGADLAARRALAPSSGRARLGRSKPYGTTTNRSRRRDAEPDEVVAHLVADGDRARPVVSASSRSIERKTRSQRG